VCTTTTGVKHIAIEKYSVYIMDFVLPFVFLSTSQRTREC